MEWITAALVVSSFIYYVGTFTLYICGDLKKDGYGIEALIPYYVWIGYILSDKIEHDEQEEQTKTVQEEINEDPLGIEIDEAVSKYYGSWSYRNGQSYKMMWNSYGNK